MMKYILDGLGLVFILFVVFHYGGLGLKNGKITPLFDELLTTAFRGHLVW